MNDSRSRDSERVARWQDSIYQELHGLAEFALSHETPGHSLQPTLLVNDAFMRLLDQRNIDPSDRAEVLAAGATIIRRLLVDYARTRKAQKRGGDSGRGVALDGLLANSANQIDILELNDALESLGTQSTRAVQVVELKFFGGLTGEEVAEQLQVSLATVNNDWRFARAWLRRAIGPDTEQSCNDD